MLVGAAKDKAKTFPVGNTKKTSLLIETRRVALDFATNTTREYVESFEAIAWGKLAERMEFIQAGQHVAVKGHLRNTSYEKDGIKIWKTIINVDDFQVDGVATPPEPSEPF
jgi:single-stranded DNA-binding protein